MKNKLKKELPKPVVLKYEMRKSGDGSFYIVIVDKNGHSSGLYINDELVSFETSGEAKEYLIELSEGGN